MPGMRAWFFWRRLGARAGLCGHRRLRRAALDHLAGDPARLGSVNCLDAASHRREVESEHGLYLPDTMPVSCFGSEERQVVAGVVRLAINAMLLLSDVGCDHLGPSNPSHFHRLERYAALARKRRSGIVEANRNLRLAPQLYGLPQNILLHAEDGTGADAPSGDGQADAPRRPHWRRGHWKMQACGPSLTQRKRLFIKPVLVNRHLLRDGGAIPRTTYRVENEPPSA